MTNNWFECKVRYDKTMENGQQKKVTETYIVSALSFTEAEARIVEEMKPFVSGEFSVKNIRRANYKEVFFSMNANADKWFACQLEFVSIDERSAKEKKTKFNVLIQSENLNDTVEKLALIIKESIVDYNALSIKETPIVEVFNFGSNEYDTQPH